MKEQNLLSGFVAGTLLHTNKALVPIQDIKVGDGVLSSLDHENFLWEILEHLMMIKMI